MKILSVYSEEGDFFMRKNKVFIILLMILMLSAYIGFSYMDEQDNEIQETLSRYGSSGSEVRQIQTRLKNWGYYKGSIDGVYGNRTYSAVKSFQRKNGLTADGIAGQATLAAMGISSSSTSSNTGTNSANINLLAHLINGEARGEPYTGMVAVGAVVLNRVASSKFPSTISGVIYQQGAFDAVSDGQINLQPSQECYNAARDAMNGWDPSGGAIYYFNPATVTNKWIWSRPMTITIGKHRFCK